MLVLDPFLLFFLIPIVSSSKHITKRQAFPFWRPCPCNPPSKPCQPGYVNPCFLGTPILSPNGQPQFCGSDPQACPSNYFCHFGAGRQTTCCCQKLSNNPCTQPLNMGRGTARLQRWYFSAQSGTCEPCIYTGIGGNQNNFLSEDQCKQTCAPKAPPVNPCSVGTPAQDISGNNLQCGLSTVAACPQQYWCHLGANLETTVCCPSTGQECSAPENIGSGEAQLQRWWYDAINKVCKPFIYRGLKGNENNHLSQDQCLRKCRKYINVCPQGIPLLIGTGEPQTCSRLQKCPVGYWCHIGASTDTTMCCQSTGDPCTLAQSPGMGSAQIQRWFYDFRQRMCAEFVYSGMRGNENNFLTRADCEAQCPVWENVCSIGQPLMEGRNQPKHCNPQNLCPANYYCHIGKSQQYTMCCQSTGQPCQLSQAVGTGNEVLSRYYYDQNTHQCLPFTYRGMKGNENNFLSISDCESVCPVYTNACNSPQPVLDRSGMPLSCQPNAPRGSSGCPSPYWCHAGVSSATTMCCPSHNHLQTRNTVKYRQRANFDSALSGSEISIETAACADPCTLLQSIGQGPDSVQRWYFNSQMGRCQTFQYSGLKGNCNNFLSQQLCRQACPERNPCQPPGQPLTQGSSISACQASNINSCPNSYFCHPGADQTDTVCCPMNGDRCKQPQLAGNGNNQLSRWYYNADLDECLSFTYRGIGGNANNFISQSVCEQACPGFRGYCPHGKPLQVLGQPQTCSVESLCQSNYVCHVNTQKAVSICCPDPTNFCFLPVDVGTCSDQKERFHYDPASDTCKPFIWSGCGGNLNNFATLPSCTKLCCKEPNQPVGVPISPNSRFP